MLRLYLFPVDHKKLFIKPAYLYPVHKKPDTDVVVTVVGCTLFFWMHWLL